MLVSNFHEKREKLFDKIRQNSYIGGKPASEKKCLQISEEELKESYDTYYISSESEEDPELEPELEDDE